MCYEFLISKIRDTFFTHLIHLYTITIIIFDDKLKIPLPHSHNGPTGVDSSDQATHFHTLGFMLRGFVSVLHSGDLGVRYFSRNMKLDVCNFLSYPAIFISLILEHYSLHSFLKHLRSMSFPNCYTIKFDTHLRLPGTTVS